MIWIQSSKLIEATQNTVIILMPCRILFFFFPELFHDETVFLLWWSIPRPQSPHLVKYEAIDKIFSSSQNFKSTSWHNDCNSIEPVTKDKLFDTDGIPEIIFSKKLILKIISRQQNDKNTQYKAKSQLFIVILGLWKYHV